MAGSCDIPVSDNWLITWLVCRIATSLLRNPLQYPPPRCLLPRLPLPMLLAIWCLSALLPPSPCHKSLPIFRTLLAWLLVALHACSQPFLHSPPHPQCIPPFNRPPSPSPLPPPSHIAQEGHHSKDWMVRGRAARCKGSRTGEGKREAVEGRRGAEGCVQGQGQDNITEMKVKEKAGGDVGSEGGGVGGCGRCGGRAPSPLPTLIGLAWCIAWVVIGRAWLGQAVMQQPLSEIASGFQRYEPTNPNVSPTHP